MSYGQLYGRLYGRLYVRLYEHPYNNQSIKRLIAHTNARIIDQLNLYIIVYMIVSTNVSMINYPYEHLYPTRLHVAL
jgi:hypothetical protein